MLSITPRASGREVGDGRRWNAKTAESRLRARGLELGTPPLDALNQSLGTRIDDLNTRVNRRIDDLGDRVDDLAERTTKLENDVREL